MKITIAGCGNMGLVYARAFLRYNIVKKENLLLVEKNEQRKEELQKLDIGKVVTMNDPAVAESELVILSVKPQDFSEIAEGLANILKPATLLVSIMAGKKITLLQKKLNHKNIVRAMPNSPVELGMGITGFSVSESISMEQIRKVENLLGTTGRTVFFEDENLLDAVTALSGSGPAYFYYILKSMIDAGKEMGFDEATSTLLVKQTMLGAFHLFNNANKSLDELIQTVASKGGTTEAALRTFNDNNVNKFLIEGIKNAEKRAKELSE
ncbi:MAG: pyrroline-5-carboxylate reductase [Bacteroidia bacterium]|nr:pyrroline-5-carboxylate reductase [Bacteroidia bacterium]